MTQYEQPTRSPSAHAAENLSLWRREVDASLAESVATAEKWRVGLAGFISILTGTLIVRGPSNVSEVREDWRIVVVGLLSTGMLLSIIALWQALAAAAPRLRVQSFDDVVSEWPSLRARNVAAAAAINRRLVAAKVLSCIALAAILIAILAWWVAPAPATTATVHVGRDGYCGSLTYERGGVVVTSADGGVHFIPFRDIERIVPGATCS